MKRIPVLTTLTALLALWTLTVFGAVPQLINFQGILKDGSGNPVANGSYSVTFRIYDAASAGTVFWSETQSVATAGGLFVVALGAVSPLPDTLFKGAGRWVGVSVEADPEMLPRTRLTSVPYSARVGTVDGATGGDITGDVSIHSNLNVAGSFKVTSTPGENVTQTIIRGAAGETANLLEIQNSDGASSVSVSSGGGTTLQSFPTPVPVTPLSIQGSPGQTAPLLEAGDNSGSNMFSIKPDGSFESKEGAFKRFAVFGHDTRCYGSLQVDSNVNIAGNFQTSGISETAGNDILVSLGTHHLAPVGIGTAPSPDAFLRVQSGTTMHELGHTLTINHGAAFPAPSDDFLDAVDESGNKVAYISSMGYVYCGGIKANGGICAAGICTAVLTVSSPTESVTLDSTNSIVLCKAVLGTIFVNLPTAVGIAGRQYTIKMIFSNSGAVIIDPFGNETIDGVLGYTLGAVNKYVTIVSDGANWWIIANN